MMAMVEIERLDEPLWLLPEKAVFRPRSRTLFIADPHFGKAATFRHAGIPVPRGTTTTDLERLSAVVGRLKAERLVVLGDFFHAAAGRAAPTITAIANWVAANRQLAVTLVRGNHDRHAGDPPQEWAFECVDMAEESPLVYLHEPAAKHERFVLCGHIHPRITLVEHAGPALRSPCFWFSNDCGVLPAFGSFTGSITIEPEADDQVFAVGDGTVVELPRRKASRRVH
jgi:uncharacterized protein